MTFFNYVERESSSQVVKQTGLFSLEVNFWALKPSLAYPYLVLAEERPTEPSASLIETEIALKAEVEI